MPPAPAATRPVDARALQAIMRRLQRSPTTPWLHGEVARRMGERLAFIKRQPDCIVDWGAHQGASQALLHKAYRRARLQAVESMVRPDSAPREAWWSPMRWRRTEPVLAAVDVPPGHADLLWANMGLHFEADIEAVLRRWREVIAVDGFLMFSTLGPGSLATLRQTYRDAGWGPAFAPLVDMHDLGDMLMQAGFAEPVMDQESLTLTWPDAAALLAELRGLGGNAAPDRHAGLRTPRWRDRLHAAIDARRDAAGRVALEFEIVYGHAFCAAPRVRMDPSTHIPMEQMRAMVRAPRRR